MLADAISRNNVALFHSLHPQARPAPEAVPEELLDVLFLHTVDDRVCSSHQI